MVASVLFYLFYGIWQAIHILLFWTPNRTFAMRAGIWIIRLACALLLGRTYVGPWVLERMSGHVKVKSISFRSIRGIYFRLGQMTWRIERAGISLSKVDGAVFLVEGVRLQIHPPTPSQPEHEAQTKHRSFRPASVFGFYLWLFSLAFSALDPVLRPLARLLFVVTMRIIIRALPRVMEKVHFEARSVEVELEQLNNMKFAAYNASLNVRLQFTELESVVPSAGEVLTRHRSTFHADSLRAWKARLSKSLGHSWDRAWGRTLGNATVTIKIRDIGGTTTSNTQAVVGIPGILFTTKVSFDPKRGTLQPHSVETRLVVEPVFVSAPEIIRAAQEWKLARNKFPVAPVTELEITPALSPEENSFSPFFEALSSSVSSRFNMPTWPRQPKKLLDVSGQIKTLISSFTSINVSLPLLRICFNFGSDDIFPDHEALVQDLKVSCRRSSPVADEIYRETQGTNPQSDCLLSDIYLHSIVVNKLSDNIQERSKRIITLANISLRILTIHWPPIWHNTQDTHQHDINSPLLIITFSTNSIDISHNLNQLLHLTKPASSKPRDPNDRLWVPPILCDVPRIVLRAKCEAIRCSLSLDDPLVSGPSQSLECHSDGFNISADSQYVMLNPRSRSSFRMPPSIRDVDAPIKLKTDVAGQISPLFVRVRSRSSERAQQLRTQRFSMLDMSDSDVWGDALLSVEAIDLSGELSIRGEMDDSDATAMLDPLSVMLAIHGRTEAICFELWNPNVIAAVTTIAETLGSRPPKAPTPDSRAKGSRLDRLPRGVYSSFSIARMVVFLTGPDITPGHQMDADLSLSRGIVLRTRIRLQYSALNQAHVHNFMDLSSRAETRHKLDLSEEHIIDAFNAARSSPNGQTVSSFFQLCFWDTGIRSATALPFVSDDPNIAEMDDPRLTSYKQFMTVKEVKVNCSLTSKRKLAETLGTSDLCQVTASLKSVDGTFALSHALSMLLALQTLQNLRPPKVKRNIQAESKPSSSLLPYSIRCAIDKVHLRWKLLDREITTRLKNFTAEASTLRPLEARWESLLCAVPVTLSSARECSHWEELLRIDNTLARPDDGGVSLSCRVMRLRLPSSYILADLILAANMTVKSMIHLARMARAGRYFDIPEPEAEEPKLLPNIRLQFEDATIEAADDDFESQLGLIWRIGSEAVRTRLEREEAFAAKLATIAPTESDESQGHSHLDSDLISDFQFSSQHSISVEEARDRLLSLHAIDWITRYREIKNEQNREYDMTSRFRSRRRMRGGNDAADPSAINIRTISRHPPLLRVSLNGLVLKLHKASFSADGLKEFLHSQGSLPLDTTYSLLVPLHLSFSVQGVRATLRDYPIPLMDVPVSDSQPSLYFDTDLVIAEEMGTSQSVDWVSCVIISPTLDATESSELTIKVPKTFMPTKTYANPNIRVTSSAVTGFSWSVSYGPALQDVARVVETITHPPPDSSPGMGFWDKMRLIFHWTVDMSFANEVRFYMKGSRDPYLLDDEGAGFALCWTGDVKVQVGYPNEDRELAQVTSESMQIIVPRYERFPTINVRPGQNIAKICAKLQGGIRFGLGFAFERACGPECGKCSGSAFERECRIWDFKPHYEVQLSKKEQPPQIKSLEDSFRDFRSDFIHLSMSLTSGTRNSSTQSNNIYLTPHMFAHFWSWLGLFDDALSLPIRHGSYYPRRPESLKFGKHLGTLKYRLSIPKLFISHLYMDSTRDSWRDGVIPFVGLKAFIEHLSTDFHQRESIVTKVEPPSTGSGEHGKSTSESPGAIRRKVLYACEMVLKEMDLRTVLAVFSEDLKREVPVDANVSTDSYRTRHNLEPEKPESSWLDAADFVELGCQPFSDSDPSVYVLPTATCPQFTYIKHNAASDASGAFRSRFGDEDTHVCTLGHDISVPKMQIHLARRRMEELREGDGGIPFQQELDHRNKMINLLQEYVEHLQVLENSTKNPKPHEPLSYRMPYNFVSPDEWTEFENVYHVHCPTISVDSAIRDILIQYYYFSRSRRGFEYHMASRAVKFIRDQAAVSLESNHESHHNKRHNNPVQTAQAAALALRKMLIGESSSPRSSAATNVDTVFTETPGTVEPLDGWKDGVSLEKGHFCLLLRPQIIVKAEDTSMLVVAAAHAKLQTFNIMDVNNIDDPVSGRVMSRNYTSLDGLQTFAPSGSHVSCRGSVPLEVLIDLRCESSDFDRIVPQTDASFHYDKFNRLRLRNNVTSASDSKDDTPGRSHSHLRDQTDLVRVTIPRFTVSANENHFQSISSVITKLVLFTDPAHKMRLDKLQTLLFSYDFADLSSAANVVASLQNRIRKALDMKRTASKFEIDKDEERVEMLKLDAHIVLLSEELNNVFDVIKLAQDLTQDHAEKSALLLHASSTEISWRMLDERRELLAKLAVRNIDFHWLNRQDSSTVNHLTIKDLQAFDGSPHATWTEIVSKHYHPPDHPLCRRDVFLESHWTTLAPVGGIAIFEHFHVDSHPMRLQLDTRVGIRIMEYVWPARRKRSDESSSKIDTERSTIMPPRASLDSSRPPSSHTSDGLAPPPLRRLGTSRSFSDLRSSVVEAPGMKKLNSQDSRTNSHTRRTSMDANDLPIRRRKDTGLLRTGPGDATEMKSRSAQRTFVHVKISSMHILLSIKQESFELIDAMIQTRDLEYRNQTWSFEELVDQFLPSDMGWTGWVKMAFNQPLIPVFPVARELISKTKWRNAKTGDHEDGESIHRMPTLAIQSDKQPQPGKAKIWRKPKRGLTAPPSSFPPLDDATESSDVVFPSPDALAQSSQRNPSKVKQFFTRNSALGRRSLENADSGTDSDARRSREEPTLGPHESVL